MSTQRHNNSHAPTAADSKRIVISSAASTGETKSTEPIVRENWRDFRQWPRLFYRYGAIDWMCVIALIIINVGVDRIAPHEIPMNASQMGDEALQYPVQGDIISVGVLVVLAFVFPIVVYFLVFIVRRKQAGAGTELRITLLAFLMVHLLTLLATSFGKKYIGRPRPDFLAANTYVVVNGVWVSQDGVVADSHQSFPSGHSSTSFTGLGFFSFWCFYTFSQYWRIGSRDAAGIFSSTDGIMVSDAVVFENRKKSEHTHGGQNNHIILLLLSTGPLWLAMFIAFSRVRDFHHSYADILAGACLGLAIAYFGWRTMYLARKREWIYINEMAFRDALKLEQIEKERGEREVPSDVAMDRMEKGVVVHTTTGTGESTSRKTQSPPAVQERAPPTVDDSSHPLVQPASTFGQSSHVIDASSDDHHHVGLPDFHEENPRLDENGLVADSLRAGVVEERQPRV